LVGSVEAKGTQADEATSGEVSTEKMMFRKTYDLVMNTPILYTDLDSQDKGTLQVEGVAAGGAEEGAVSYDFMWAGFGKRSPVTAEAVMCDPERADAELKNADQLKDKWAVVKRGANSFAEKVRRAQAAGAAGVIIVNSDDSLVKAGGDDGEEKIKIPALLVSNAWNVSAGARVSIRSDMAKGAGGDEQLARAGSEQADVDTGSGDHHTRHVHLVLPLITQRVPLLPFEEMDILVPKVCVCVSVCLSVCLSVSVCFCLSVSACLSVSPSIAHTLTREHGRHRRG
jgi:hypothetical protein